MSLQEPKEQFEREEAEPTEESQDSSVESSLSDSDTLLTASESESIDVPIEEGSPAPSDDSDFADELESAEDVPADGKLASSSEEAPRPEVTEGPAWFVLHCYSGYENKVRHNLEQRIETMGMKDKIFDVVIPTQEEIEVKDGKRRTGERRVFPGYILGQMILGGGAWHVAGTT